jgi:DNA-binding response OmpR family regulator
MSNDKKTVLIADDEPSTLALLGRHLRSRGYNVLEASDGDHAWELAHEHLPDLVILDVMMPGMSGWEVCRRVREAVSLAHTGVVMLTGIGESLNEMTSPLYGADAHVDKPFEFALLDRKVQETLERRQAGALGRPDTGAEEVRVALPRALPRRAPSTKPKETAAARAVKPAAPSATKAAGKAPAAVARAAAKKPAERAKQARGGARATPSKPVRKKSAKKPARAAKTARRGARRRGTSRTPAPSKRAATTTRRAAAKKKAKAAARMPARGKKPTRKSKPVAKKKTRGRR